MGISLVGLSPRYQYLNIFNVDKDNDLDENDHPLFKDAKTAEEAEKVVMDNIEELSGLSSIPLACLSRDTLPKTYIKVKIATVIDKDTGERKAVVDGDTIKLDCDLDNDGKLDSVRFKGVNTTEFGKGGGLKSRISRAEPGAVAAWEAMCELFKNADYEVYVCPERYDSNNRMVSQVFVKNKDDSYTDVEAFLASKGHAMAYFVQIEDYNEYFCYLSLQAQAQKQKKELWGLDFLKDKNDPTGQKLKLIHLTSFHPNARGVRGNKEPLYNEYCRIVNISNHSINMKDYQIYNKDSEKTVNLPDFILPPGRTLKIATGEIKTQADPKDELVLSMGMEEEFWENEGGACLVIQTKDGKTTGAIGTGRFKKNCP